ncbi:hypothetical protein I5M32_04310 [Pedobacter sp. SD-b]|uniref:Uncharacterized protein n=1 Tax=Pedobacter segetis TaxID=2793069 RepID=A0ABS1BH27_9SPHI|nr:hypothetical protein [Pedobacter segetis]MBK0382175.1 hypothetical protein [Pedobacter segetis]
MEKIVLEVEDSIAEKWRNASQELKNRVLLLFDIKLSKELIGDDNKAFEEYLEKLRNTMEQRGLTDDILNEILEED